MNLLDDLSIATLLMIIGSLLIVAEVFFPSGGVLGLFAGLSLVASVYYAYLSGGIFRGVLFAGMEAIVVPTAVYAAFTYLPYTPLGKLLLGSAPTSDEVRNDDARHALEGRIGLAKSKMLPSGVIEIDGERLDAISQGQAIDPGQAVKVIEVRGNRIMVRRAEQSELATAEETSVDPLARPAETLGLGDFDFDTDSQSS
ncbi:hypothetical protein Mal64_22310 [Pseudobythopirellula maris]|uniref:NfeD-like C-terminal domain-containing protein n=1 Tax=Pseudobythopirellula maris TaxID=2527991 RepID=A0A5C5ZR09_9BACT|nr:NfeD family protein [Pseudobythopirellula maris]TWT88743.1 hypothetical protein Mal64_22310 [Pseudobythopirellula maris]